jgi:hypothetical protein
MARGIREFVRGPVLCGTRRFGFYGKREIIEFNSLNPEVAELVDELQVMLWRWALDRICMPTCMFFNGVGSQGLLYSLIPGF